MLLSLSSIGASNRVVAYTVHEPPEPPQDPAERAESLVFVKDGMSWFALFLAPLWMLGHRLWLALLGYLVVAVAIGAVIGLSNASATWAVMANLALNLIVALEADAIQRWSLDRKGWRMIGTVEGASARECERRFFERWLAELQEARYSQE